MRRRQVTGKTLIKGAVIASAIAAILAFAAHKSGRDVKLSLESLKTTTKDAVKDIRIPEPISAADVNKLLSDNKRIVEKGRKASKKLYKRLEKEAAKQIEKSQDKFRK